MGDYYPAMLRIEGRRCVVIGGGRVAERKVRGLLAAGADVLVVAPALTAQLAQLADEGKLRVERRAYAEGDVAGAALAFAATDSRETNAAVAAEAEAAGIPVNVADAGEDGSFLTPAVVRCGGLVLAVSASGVGPGLAARIAGELERRYGAEWESHARWLGELRKRAKARIAEAALRRRLLQAALDVPAAERAADTDASDFDRRLSTLLAQLSGGMTDDSGAEAEDDQGGHEAERPGADPDGSGD